MARKSFVKIANHCLFFLLIFIPMVVSSCSGNTQTISSGIKGIVMIGPVSPVVQEGEINEKPYPDALIYILDKSGKKVKEVISDKEGRFTIDLQPGKYVLAPQTPKDSVLPVGEAQEVLVSENAYTDITVSYDSGIR